MATPFSPDALAALPPPALSPAEFDAALRAEGVTGRLAAVARSIYQQESGAGRNPATSAAGAVGGMQLLPETFSRYADRGWSVYNPEQNARAALRYIKALAARTGGDPRLIAVGYYGGEGAIPDARRGVARADPRDPAAPSTLQYGAAVARRAAGEPADYLPPPAGALAAPAGDLSPPATDYLPPPPAPPRSLGAQALRQVELTARAAGPYAAGALAGAALGAPLGGVGALPGAAAGVGAVALSDLAAGLYNPLARAVGWRQLPGPTAAVDALLDRAGFARPESAEERVVQDATGAMAGTGAAARAADVGANALARSPAVRNFLAQLAQKPLAQTALGAVSGGAGGAVREAGYGPATQFAASLAAGAVPLGVDALVPRSGRATRNAARMLRQATEHHTGADWDRAQELLDYSHGVGVPLLGPEALPGGSQVQQLASDVAASPAAGNKLREFTRQRPAQVRAAAGSALRPLGSDIGAQAAANQAQEAADAAIRERQRFRTAAAGPDYQAQRASDAQALQLQDELSALNSKLLSLGASRDTSMQVAGKLHAFANEQIQAANRTIRRGLGYAGDVKAQRNLDVADQAKGATHEANNRARVFAARLGDAQRQLDTKVDALAQKNLPAIRGQVAAFVNKLDGEIRLAGPTEEGRLLRAYRDQLAPGGEPLVLPSQLESVYKGLRDRTTLGMNPTPEERTAAGVLKGQVKALDGLIRKVSPAIAQGRLIYEQLSKELVDPLLKGPVGRVAGSGADAQKEAALTRALGELQGPGATPRRIATLAKELGRTDKAAFPNLVRAYLENRLNDSLAALQGRENPAAGAKFRNAVAGTPRDAENLRTMLQNVAVAQGANPKQVWAGFSKLLDVLDATGRVPGMGSQTQSRMENAATARESVLAGGIEAASTHPTARIGAYLRNLAYRGTYKKLADVFTDPQAVRKMQQLAVLDPRSLRAQQLVLALLTSAARGAEADDTGSEQPPREGQQQ